MKEKDHKGRQTFLIFTDPSFPLQSLSSLKYYTRQFSILKFVSFKNMIIALVQVMVTLGSQLLFVDYSESRINKIIFLKLILFYIY